MTNVRFWEDLSMEKIALVTGASRGIGKATALALARDDDEPVHVPAPDVVPVSTVGAGDSYWAVFLHHVLKLNIPKRHREWFEGLWNRAKSFDLPFRFVPANTS